MRKGAARGFHQYFVVWDKRLRRTSVEFHVQPMVERDKWTEARILNHDMWRNWIGKWRAGNAGRPAKAPLR